MIKTSPTNQCLNPHLPKYLSDVLYFIDKIFIFSYRIEKVMIKRINIANLDPILCMILKSNYPYNIFVHLPCLP
jgi:hypothetical protein